MNLTPICVKLVTTGGDPKKHSIAKIYVSSGDDNYHDNVQPVSGRNVDQVWIEKHDIQWAAATGSSNTLWREADTLYSAWQTLRQFAQERSPNLLQCSAVDSAFLREACQIYADTCYLPPKWIFDYEDPGIIEF